MAAPVGTRPVASTASRERGLDSGHLVVLNGATWADYQRVLELRGANAVPRVTFLEGRLELMSPSKSLESVKSMIGCLVEAWCMVVGVDVSPYGSWTLENEESERGLEPDECYVVGNQPDAAQPDLAIEVVWTSGGVDKLEVYRKLGVREVWYWRDGHFDVFLLRGQTYEHVDSSEVLPGIDLTLLARFIEVKPMTQAVRAYQTALRSESPER